MVMMPGDSQLVLYPTLLIAFFYSELFANHLRHDLLLMLPVIVFSDNKTRQTYILFEFFPEPPWLFCRDNLPDALNIRVFYNFF